MSGIRNNRHPDRERLLELVSDCYWEQDADSRFTLLEAFSAKGRAIISSRNWLGHRPSDLGVRATGDVLSSAQDRSDPADTLFRDRIVSYTQADGAVRYLSISGAAVVGPDGRMTGYHGFCTDVTEQQSQQRELTRFRAAMDASQAMIYIVDRQTMRFVYVNEMACKLSGFDRDALMQVPPHELLMVERAQLERDYDEVIRSDGTTREARGRTGDGQRTIVEIHQRAVNQNGHWLIVSHVHDISERKQAERARARLERMYATLSATNEAILRAATPDELYQQVCDAAVDGGDFYFATVLLVDSESPELAVIASSGRSPDAIRELEISIDASRPRGCGLVGECVRTRTSTISNHYLADARTEPWHNRAQNTGVHSAAAIPLIKNDGVFGALLLTADGKHAFDDESISLLERMAENLVFALVNFEHEAARARGAEYIEHLATHDNLTNLPNRSLFNQLLSTAIESARRHDRQFALIFMDLDRFKIINDSLGHDAGDVLLRETARRLTACLRASDVVARIGGDEFLILAQEIDGRKAAARIARTILAAVLEPVQITERDWRITASVGIALFPDHADDAATLLKHADMAMYQAKEEGRNNFQIYSSRMQARTLEREQLEVNLRQALERGELSLAYQAQMSLSADEITGVEALLRWDSAELGVLTPNRFLPIAEQTGLILPIGRWVLETACAQNVAWQQAGLSPVRMAVNLSPVQFTDAKLIHHLKNALQKTGMSADLLELEITESAIMRDVDNALKTLRAIKRLGVHIAIDNFGTGYSSLMQLQQLPIDSLKIDRSFIRDLSNDAVDQSIAQAIISMAKHLSLNVAAEGVETAEQQSYLRSHDCDDIQGFYFSRPQKPAQLAELLRTHAPDTRNHEIDSAPSTDKRA